MDGSKLEKEIHAMAHLLDDPDTRVIEQITGKMLSFGPEVIAMLEKEWENTSDAAIQHRLENIIHRISFNDTRMKLAAWRDSDMQSLLEGFLLITRYQYPDIDESKIISQVDRIKQDVWLEISNNLTSLEKIKVMNHILFEMQRFRGNVSDMTSPLNFYLNNVLESKKGNLLSIGLLYLIIAQGCGMPVYGVDLPEHFILCYARPLHESLDPENLEQDVLFYINPFKKGAVFTANEIKLFLEQMKITPQPGHFAPCSAVTVITRLLAEMVDTYSKLGNLTKAEELEELKKDLGKSL